MRYSYVCMSSIALATLMLVSLFAVVSSPAGVRVRVRWSSKTLTAARSKSLSRGVSGIRRITNNYGIFFMVPPKLLRCTNSHLKRFFDYIIYPF
jgi:hypothetical protein